ncbi:MAG: hypothetical protein COA84_15170 [Robiginitomaculum sp.]|nr:MAG: hypothetical protein COA84_15170 [Robiginitomaculum sp.]
MSIKIMSKIWEDGPQKHGALLVILVLADRADDDGVCWPAINTIAKKARMTTRSAQRNIRDLEAAGWLTIQTGGGRKGSNKYIINPDARVTPDKKTPLTPASPPPDARVAQPLTPASPNTPITINEPSIKEKNARPKKSDRQIAFDILIHVASEDAVNGFLEMRWKKRATMSKRASELIANQLRGKMNADEILDLSTQNNWTGIFPESKQLKGGNHGNGNGNPTGASGAHAQLIAAFAENAARYAAEDAAIAAGKDVDGPDEPDGKPFALDYS